MTAGVILTSLSCLVCLLWAARHLVINGHQRRQMALGPDYSGPPANAPAISVIVAAKDEAQNIEPCLRSLLKQDYPDFEIIVCNDRSLDDTAAIIQRIAGEDARVQLVNIETLPAGWYGKNHALVKGFEAARGEWICTTDADCRQLSTRTLSVAMQYAMDSGADLLSVLPVMETHSFAEEIIQPVCGGVMMVWFDPGRVNDPRKSTAYANGAFMLMRRSSYEAIGTHEAIKGILMEDLHIARRIKQAGMNLKVVQGIGLYTVRMYTSLKEIVRGWSRIYFGSFRTPGRLAGSLALLVVMGLLPYAAVGVGFALAATGARAVGWWMACGLAGLAAAAMQLGIIFRFYKLIGARKSLAWTYPLGCIGAIAAVLMAIGKLLPGAKVTWRGTSYEAQRESSASAKTS